MVTSRPSRIHTVPSPITTSQCQRAHGSRSSRAGMSVVMRPVSTSLIGPRHVVSEARTPRRAGRIGLCRAPWRHGDVRWAPRGARRTRGLATRVPANRAQPRSDRRAAGATRGSRVDRHAVRRATRSRASRATHLVEHAERQRPGVEHGEWNSLTVEAARPAAARPRRASAGSPAGRPCRSAPGPARRCSGRSPGGTIASCERRVGDHVVDRLLAAPAERVQAGVDDEPAGAHRVGGEHPHPVDGRGVEPHLVGEPLGVEPPALGVRRVVDVLAELRHVARARWRSRAGGGGRGCPRGRPSTPARRCPTTTGRRR